jgi:molecular chaperone Hsp33
VADIGADELLLRPAEELLQRAVPGLDLRMFDTQAVNFACRCSRERVTGMLRSLGAAEVRSIVAEQGAVTVTCEFCQKPWRFDSVDTTELFGAAAEHPPGSPRVN